MPAFIQSSASSLPTVPFRWVVLCLIPFTPFAGHFFKNSLSSLEVFLLDDPRLSMTSTMFGSLVASFSASSTITPLIGGHLFDMHGHRSSLMSFLSLSALGVLLVTLFLQLRVWPGVLFGGLLFGAAHANVVVASRAVISRYFSGGEMTMGMGVSVGVACLGEPAPRLNFKAADLKRL
jgi:MFS family permease